MKRLSIISIAVALAALVLSMLAGRNVDQQRSQLVANQAQMQRVYLPRFGMDKYLADLRWVMLVQQMGQVKGGKITPEAGAYFADALEAITDMDPEFEKAYTMGAMLISSAVPIRAVKLLEKGVAQSRNPSWRYYFNLGFVAQRQLPNAGVPEEECQAKSLAAYEAACKLGDCPGHVERAWMYQATRGAGSDPVKVLLAQKDFVLKVHTDSFSDDSDSLTGGTNEFGPDSGTTAGRLSAWLAGRSRSLSHDLLARHLLETDAAKRQSIEADLKAVRAVYDQIRTLGLANADHACKHCLSAFGPGEFYCSSCGQEVKAYGYCRTCHAANGKLVLPHGAYCHVCGTKAAAKVTTANK